MGILKFAEPPKSACRTLIALISRDKRPWPFPDEILCRITVLKFTENQRETQQGRVNAYYSTYVQPSAGISIAFQNTKLALEMYLLLTTTNCV